MARFGLDRRRLMAGLVAAVSLGALVQCSPAPSDPSSPSALTDVTICQYGDLLIYLPIYIAQDQKLFEAQGVKVKLINGGGDDKTFAALAAGSAQFGVSDPTFTAIARERGERAVVIGTVVAGATYWGVTWNDAIKPATSAAGLKDLRIATYEAPSTNYALMAKTLKEHKDEVGSATIVQGSYGGLFAMLKANRADVAMELEPAASTAVKQGAHIVYSYPEAYGPFLLTGLYTMERYRDANRGTTQGVVTALEKAMRYAHDNPEGAIAVARRKFPDVDPEVIRSAVTRMIKESTLPGHVTMDRQGWANAVNVRVTLGDLKKPAEADATLDPSFAAVAVAAR
jgi:NitT/TauT family transport system substrate-binding protein